jgi:predicted nucleic acid-binding protein
MVVFLDTSSLIKRYVEEPGSSDASVFVSSDKNLIKAAETNFLGRVVMIA